jgi:hypothetical protein
MWSIAPKNLTPNPFPSGKGHRIFGDTRRVVFNTGCRGTPAEGSVKPTAGFTLNKVIYPSPLAGLSISARLR